MSRPLGGYIGYDAEPATTAAPGIWTLREAEFYKRKAQWPLRFEPDYLTGLQLWLDASDASTLYDATTGGSLVAADGSVARWEDKSGNDRHATQGTSGNRPLRKASVQNGLDGLRFDGSDDFLSVPSSTATFNFLHNAQATTFIVAKVGFASGSNSLGAFISQDGISNVTTGFTTFYNDASTNTDMFDVNIGNSTSDEVARDRIDNAMPVDTTALFAVAVDATNATQANRIKIYKNGGTESSTELSTSYGSADTGNASNNLTVGQTGNGSFPLDGDICEIIIYNSALSDTDREAVQDYLIEKWGIT